MNNKNNFRINANDVRLEERSFAGIAALSLLVFLIMILCARANGDSLGIIESRSADFSTGWDYEVTDKEGSIISQGAVDFPCSLKAEDGGRITFKKTLPYGFDGEKFYLETSIIQQNCRIYIDDKEEYHFENDGSLYERLKRITISNDVIFIPYNSGGKTLKMEFENAEGLSRTMYTECALGTHNDILLHNLTYKTYRNLLPIILMLFSVIALVSELILSQDRTGEEAKRFFVFTACCIGLAMWFISGTVNTIQFTQNIGVLKLPGIVAFYVARLAFALFGLVDINRKSRLLKMTFWLVFIYSWLTVFTGWKHPGRELMIFSAIVVLHGCMRVYYTFIRKSRKFRLADHGSCCFFAAAVAQAVICIIDPVNCIYQSILCLGAVLNIVFKMLDILYIGLRNNVLRNELENEIYKKQTESLLERLNMHFLFNAFGVLNRSIMSGSKKASGLCLALSGWMRYTTDSFRKDELVSIHEEINYLKDFALLQQSRFSDKVRIEFDIEDIDFQVPRLCVQPLVENAINGLRKCSETGLVRIVTRKRPGGYKIMVSNDGCGYFTYIEDQAMDDIITIGNRIRYMTRGRIDYRNEDDGTVVTITIPEKEN